MWVVGGNEIGNGNVYDEAKNFSQPTLEVEFKCKVAGFTMLGWQCHAPVGTLAPRPIRGAGVAPAQRSRVLFS